MSRSHRGAVGVLVALALLVLAGCGSGSSGADPKPSGGDSASASPSSSPSSATTGALRWTKCDGNFQCATLKVPLDYSKPDGRTVELALSRRPATDQKQRIGSLLVNPGGPGGSGVEFAENLSLPTAVTDRFDVVGFDPRGVGRSSPLDCHSHLQEMYDADPTMEDAADRTRYLKVSREYVDECATKEKAVLPYLGTPNVARDMDRIRAAVGDRKLTYLGFSYGTSIGQQYARLFPTRIRAMVLDGVVDTQQTGLQAADEQARGFEVALQAYVADCKRQGRKKCALAPDPEAKLRALVASAERAPIPATGADRPATPGVVQLAIGQTLYSKSLWPALTAAVTTGLRGNGAILVQLADQYLGRQSDGSYGNSFDIYFAVSCLDSAWPRNPAAVLANAKATGKKYPLIGEGLVNDYVRCALWPTKPQPLPKLTAPGSPPIVVVSTTRDPATPYENGVKVAKRLPKGVLITNVGDGHTVYSQGKACVDDAVDAYLVRLKAPRNGLRCA